MFIINTILKIVLLTLLLLSGVVFAQNDNTDIVEALTADSDSTESKKLSFNGYPYAYFTPETQLAFGIGGIFIFYTSDYEKLKPSKIGIGGWYSTNKQYNIAINPVMYFSENRIYIELPFNFGHFIDKFWGIGNNTIETGNEEYTLDQFAATLKVQIPPVWFASDRTGIIIDYDDTEIVDKMNNEILQNDEVIGSNGGQLIGIGTDLVWDTRDNLFFPNHGIYQYMKFVVYPSFNDYAFYTFELDVRHYNSFSKDHVLAGNIYFAGSNGEVPFYKLQALGGQNRMRGYFEGRYRDKNYLLLQLEYRQYFWWKFGFAVFVGAGDVASELMKFNLNDMKFSYGAGLRFLFNKEEKVNLRVDFGIGNDGNSGVYFGIEEAF